MYIWHWAGIEPRLHLLVTALAPLHIPKVVKISRQLAHFTGYFEYCAGYSECQ